MMHLMRMRQITAVTLAVLFTGLGLGSCGSDRSVSADTGSLTLNLGTQVNGVTYRLRDAVFELSGRESRLLSSESASGDLDYGATTVDGSQDCGDASGFCPDSLIASLLVGSYSALLRDGWHMERSSGNGFADVSAALVSGNPVGFAISSGEITRVAYAFEVDGTIIDFDRGTLELSIEVREVDPDAPEFDASFCDFDDLTGCDALSCEAACPTNDGGSCQTRCSAVIDCIAADPTCVEAADPLCGARVQTMPDVCTQVVESAGGTNVNPPLPGGTPQPAFVARELVRCLCSVPRP